LKIGIPRALLYYWYGFIWERFWHDSGFEVLTSPETNRQIMMAGVETALDELCLPVKIFLGHVRFLAPQVDQIMIPHLIKVEKDAFVCPKFMGLPDIVSHAIPALKKKMLVVQVGPHQVDMLESLKRASHRLGVTTVNSIPKKLSEDMLNMKDMPALNIIKACQREGKLENSPGLGLNIGLLGHPYCLYDACLNLDLLQMLTKQGISFITPEMIPPKYKGVGSGKLVKKLFWTTGRSQFDALEWMLNGQDKELDGFIQIAPFACGPEAIVSDMLERRIKAAKKPYLQIYYEEHSGEAGIITRLEAFLDLLKYQCMAC
jgi:predicted nucleotide-binding protein (sugar kinase/HSP70/actin superfamily)